ncbi:MAG: TDP-N-acetylfucosamine:lipid II N-acetylfucosaminyltransferase [Clostridium butyricum]|nr:TDP-N-acetylfucosamine:lipid II N-acetylfucosaminyltransferase [Clostridium butyricum]MDU4802758.1 TDP-N-acetylfucosamine:lipid II N-acetylfucosaminyltransferase [Clostridium butyricum]
MNIHIFPREKFTVAYINFINKNFCRDKHLFFLHGSNDSYKESDLEFSDNVKDIDENMYLFLVRLNRSKKILIHSLIIPKKLLVFLAVQKRLLNKMIWIVWGADLYYYREIKHNYKEKLLEYFRRKFIKNVDSMATLVREDYDLAIKWYKTNAKYFYAAYMDNEKTIQYLKNIRGLNDDITKDYISILIGNSATETNNHIEVFKLLEKYKKEKIKIVCPLSYGDLKYAEQIIDCGKNIFDDKFIPLTSFMDSNEYMDLLNSVDIGIFNNNRQQALGNIFSLGYLGKKVYIRDDTSMWNELNSFLKLRISKISKLKEEDFKSFIYISDHDKQVNYMNLKHRYDTESIRITWENIFNS